MSMILHSSMFFTLAVASVGTSTRTTQGNLGPLKAPNRSISGY